MPTKKALRERNARYCRNWYHKHKSKEAREKQQKPQQRSDIIEGSKTLQKEEKEEESSYLL